MSRRTAEGTSGSGMMLRPFWARIFRSDLSFTLIAFVLLGIVRIVGLVRGEINIVVAGFLIMWFLPILFLRKEGRCKIGIKRPESWLWLVLALVLGIGAGAVVTLTGQVLYGTGIENWAMATATQYVEQGEAMIPAVFAVVTFLSMLFSPIGEELFFRGIIHETLADRLSSDERAGFWASLAFALIHIPHHDIIFAQVALFRMLLPLLLWTLFMFGVSYLFILARKRSGSIFGAIICHSGYILGMNVFIYSVLLPML